MSQVFRIFASMDTRQEKWKILSGSALKMLAVVSMLVDHLAAYLWYEEPWCTAVLFSVGHKEISAYVLMRMFGRIAFPLFAFLLVEGFQHTRSRKRYGIQLFIFAFSLKSRITWCMEAGSTADRTSSSPSCWASWAFVPWNGSGKTTRNNS